MFNAREYSFLTYLETLVKDIHFQQTKIAAARSPCSGSKTIVLHFKVKNTPLQLKDKKWTKKVQKNVQFSFCGGMEAFHQEIICFEMQPRQCEVFAKFSGTSCTLWSRKPRF